MKPIYIDNMATTPIDPRVISVMLEYMGPEAHFGNASSLHVYGQDAAIAIENARELIATCVGATASEIIFTSGATEANNLAILGAVQFYQRKGKHLITMSTEHKSVLDAFHYLEKQGFTVTYLQPEADGLLNLDKLVQALRHDTIFVSIMHVNNEIGVIQDIQSIGNLLKNKGIIFHVDAAQSVGKVPVSLDQWSVDLMSFSAHKVYGPKGIGALFVRQKPRIRLMPQSYGGGHEWGLRSGTLPTHQIVGMGEAFKLAHDLMDSEQSRFFEWREKILAALPAEKIRVNGSLSQRVASNLNLCFPGFSYEALYFALNQLAFSSTSACVAMQAKPSYVLSAIGLTTYDAQSSIRLSFGRFNTSEDIQALILLLQQLRREQV